jgi:sodium-dependent dicarboxylate transporter 2/3/5
MVRKWGLLLGPILFIIILLLPFPVGKELMQKVLAVAAWIITWWITEAVNISVTALLPLALFPIMRVMELKEVASSYGSPIIFLFFGGFVIALALEKVRLHRRIALNIIRLTGTSPDRVVLGFMIATAFLSMWISNTATTLVMLPIAISVIDLIRQDLDGFTKQDRRFSLSIMLGIAYAANIGGVGTIIGTPPNMVMVGFLQNEYDISVSFLQWMLIGIPFSIIMITILYWVLVKWLLPSRMEGVAADAVIRNELHAMGPVSKEEKRVLLVFTLAIILWVFKDMVNKALPFITLSDMGISIVAAVLLFSWPVSLKKGRFLLEWEDTSRLPWGILILFGGGLSLAAAMSASGIVDLIGSSIAGQASWSLLLVSALLITVMIFMTELMSNVALVTIFLPVVAGIATGLDIEMMHILVPVTIASSCAFMLPMATPPNAIVFASGHVHVNQMVKAGIYLNIVSVIVILAFMKWVIPFIW